ncbi:MAG: hypothetical protein Q4D03_01130 [Bacteroidales bacterium]|nr:hypothetical protein [Bacteroidales bacterium]
MKKILIAVALLGSLGLLASCTSKTCVCYQVVNGHMTMNDTYTDLNTACASLTNDYRVCVEESERVNPEDVAWK